MKRNLTLTITSLLSIILFSFHWADDIVRGSAPGGVTSLGGVAILVKWLCGTLLLSHRKLGYIIMLLGSISGLGVLIMSGLGLVGGRIAHASGMFFWVWTLLAIGVSSTFSAILSASECGPFYDFIASSPECLSSSWSRSLLRSCRPAN